MASVPTSSRAARADARARIPGPVPVAAPEVDNLSKINPVVLVVPPIADTDPCDDALFTHLFHLAPIFINIESNEAKLVIREFLETFYGDDGPNPPQCDCIAVDGRKCFGNECANQLNKRACAATCGPSCENQGFNGLVPVTSVSLSGNHLYGRCLVAEKLIRNGEILFEVVGRVVEGSPSPGQRRAFPIKDRGLEKDLYIDCERTGNVSAFIHYSKTPNTQCETWIVGRTLRMFLRSIKAIKPGTVITYETPHMKEDFKLGCSTKVLAEIEAARPLTSPLPGRNTYRLSPDTMTRRADERTSPPLPTGFITCADGNCDCGNVVVCARDQNPAIAAMKVQQKENYLAYLIRKLNEKEAELEEAKNKNKGKGKQKSK